MLKIKSEVDLKELEKFGFKKQYDIDTADLVLYQHRHYEFVWVGIKDRDLKATPKTYEEDIPINDLLYDLIKADLVEKVGDE